jgi:putative two-component system response regulator
MSTPWRTKSVGTPFQAFSSFNILLASHDVALSEELAAELRPFGYQVAEVTDSMAAIEQVRNHRPDLVIAEVTLPPLTGYELCQAIKQDPALKATPVMLVTPSYGDVEARVKGLANGADDLIARPVHGLELRARVRSQLRLKAYVQQILFERSRLEELVKERIGELEQMTIAVVAALEKASTMNDMDTGAHLRRVSGYSETLARAIGLEPAFVTRIARYSSLHDVGKVGLPDAVLKKERDLTPEEFEVMKTHTTMGYEVLAEAKADPVACRIALYHHERFDGSGYPKGLRANEIPVEARIVALADVFDALTTRRCYKEPLSPSAASKLVLTESGRHFDSSIVRGFMQSYEEMLLIFEKNQDDPRFAGQTDLKSDDAGTTDSNR